MIGSDDMKVLTVILLLVLMIGVTPAFAASSPADEQVVASTAVKGANIDIKNVSSENSGFIDGYDDGNYIGNYIVVDSSDTSNLPDEIADNNDQSDDNVVDLLDRSEDGDIYNVVGSVDTTNISDEVNEGYELKYDDYIVINSSDVSDRTDGDNNNTDESIDDENGNYRVIESYNEFEYTFELLNENDDADELDGDDYIVIDSSNQLFEDKTASQIDTNVPTFTGGHLLANLVDELCGVVQSILGGLDIISMY